MSDNDKPEDFKNKYYYFFLYDASYMIGPFDTYQKAEADAKENLDSDYADNAVIVKTCAFIKQITTVNVTKF